MVKRVLTAFFILAGLLLIAVSGFCDTIEGTVTYLDPVHHIMSVREKRAPHEPVNLHLFTFNHAGDLKTGQMVTVSSHKGETPLIAKADKVDQSE